MIESTDCGHRMAAAIAIASVQCVIQVLFRQDRAERTDRPRDERETWREEHSLGGLLQLSLPLPETDI